VTTPDTPAEGRVKVVYCGGCNPHIDRESVAAGLPVDDPAIAEGATVHVSGCQRACASDRQLVVEGDDRSASEALPDEPATPLEKEAGAGAQGAPAGRKRPPVVVVAGELVDGVPTPQDELAAVVTRKLKE
jgi:hypothetical protein